MAIKKIPCGGWLYDDEQITFEDGVMKVVGGGSGGGAVVDITFVIDAATMEVVSSTKTCEETEALYLDGAIITGKIDVAGVTAGLGTLVSLNGVLGFLPSVDIADNAINVEYVLGVSYDDETSTNVWVFNGF